MKQFVGIQLKMRRERLTAIRELDEIANALRIAGHDRFRKEIQDIEYEVKKLRDSKVQFVYMDLVLAHIIMSASLRASVCASQA